jgi:hypothetical protein
LGAGDGDGDSDGDAPAFFCDGVGAEGFGAGLAGEGAGVGAGGVGAAAEALGAVAATAKNSGANVAPGWTSDALINRGASSFPCRDD